ARPRRAHGTGAGATAPPGSGSSLPLPGSSGPPLHGARARGLGRIPMGWDFETPSQDDWLGPVPKRAKSTPATQVTWDNPGHSPDVQLNQGICMALCYKWAGMGVRGEDLATFLTDTTKD